MNIKSGRGALRPSCGHLEHIPLGPWDGAVGALWWTQIWLASGQHDFSMWLPHVDILGLR